MINRSINLTRTLIQRGSRGLSRTLRSGPSSVLDQRSRQIQNSLLADGVVTVENFLAADQCEALKECVDRVLDEYRDTIWRDDQESDWRAFGAERVDETIASFGYDRWLVEMMLHYTKASQYSGLTLANRVCFQPGNLGSGGGWHKDTAKARQFKAILYLNDVDDHAGPFQYCIGTHRVSHTMRSILRHGYVYNQHRFEGQENDEMLAAHERIRTIVGGQGTLLLADTSGIHRGKPVERGERYALTNYYWPGSQSIPSGFDPIMVDRQSRRRAA